MQDVDGPDNVQAFAQPARTRRPRVEVKSLGLVLRSERLDGIVRDSRRKRDLGQKLAVGTVEPKLAVGLAIYPVAFLVHRTMVPATEHREVRERGGPAQGPVADVMPLDEAGPAAREAAPAVAMEQGAPQRRGNRSGPGADLYDAAVRIMPH